jgi:lipase maturation factor 1
MPDLKFYSKIFSSIRVHFERMLSKRWVKSVLGIRQGEPSSFQFAHWFYGRCLGLVALIAFLSYWYQADALIGENGIAPWQADLEKVERFVEKNEETQSKWKLRPTLLWLEPLANVDLIFTVGTISALLLALGVIPLASGIVSYLCYLSLMVVGEPFLSFQWDILLVESLFLSLPFLPLTKFHSPFQGLPYSNWARILILALLAKLMLESGIVKFTYFDSDGSNTWIDGTALDYHYWTQPIPHGLSAWIDSLPGWFDGFSLYSMYAVELVLPFLFFLPGNFRRIALIGQIVLQVVILLSGNYGFFNLLTIVLCIPLIDDRMIPEKLRKRILVEKETQIVWKALSRNIALTGLCFFFLVTAWSSLSADLRGNQEANQATEQEPSILAEARELIRPLRAFNSYGLFRVMTRNRPEILIEGSSDGEHWETYHFRWKPTDLKRRPGWAGPHMPRIDWQMWFEGLNAERHVAHPFSRFLYGRFLEIMATGGTVKECFDLRTVLGEREFRALANANPTVQQQAIANFNALMNAFIARSQWFGKFLHALLEERKEVLDQLAEIPSFESPPNFLRVSIKHYRFASEEQKEKGIWWIENEIPDAVYVLKKQKNQMQSAITP